MRVFALSFACSTLALIAVLPLASSTPTPDPTLTSPSLERGYDEGGKGLHPPKPTCWEIKTRDHETCQCLPGFEEPSDGGGYGNWKKSQLSSTSEADRQARSVDVEARGGGWEPEPEPECEECVCPDKPNTYIDYGGWGNGGDWKRNGKGNGGHGHHPMCKCKGEHQTYNPYTEKCECEEGYEPANEWSYDKRGGKHGGGHKKPLKCKPCPTPSGGYNNGGHGGGGHKGNDRKRSPSLHEVIKSRDQDDRALETLLGCKGEERACESEGSWACTDVSSSLWSCGGCPGQGIDCGSLPGVSEIRCHHGHCTIDTCRRGYLLKPQPDPEFGINTSCVVEYDREWRFVTQGE